MAEFERGDVVLYNVRQTKGMRIWAHLNGAVGVVREADIQLVERGRGALIAWIGQMHPQYHLDNDKPYPYYLLEKVGHIDLPTG